MKQCILIGLFIATFFPLKSQHFGFSSGLYRIPYANGIIMTVGSDVYTHSPVGKYDLLTAAESPTLVAAAAGWVRWIQESFDTSCAGANCCWMQNNYVIIEHPNGEWSQYTHMDPGSVSGFGITLNEWVTAGTPIGTEGTIECSTGDHLHFEVSRPNDPAVPFDTIGGFLDCICSEEIYGISEMLIPVIAGTGTIQSWMVHGAQEIGGPMDDNCPTSKEVIGSLGNGDEYAARADNTVFSDDVNPNIFSSGSSSIFRAGGYIQLRPGFHAKAGAKFKAIIKTCNQEN